MRSDYYILERKYREMKNSYFGVINANIKLQDERDLALRDVKVLQKRINLVIDCLNLNEEISKDEILEILKNG